MNYYEENLSRLIRHFERGCKMDCFQKLGLEVALTSVRRSGFAQLVGWVQRRAGELAQETP